MYTYLINNVYVYLHKLASLAGQMDKQFLPTTEKAYISLYSILRLDKEIEEDLRKDKLLMSPQ